MEMTKEERQQERQEQFDQYNKDRVEHERRNDLETERGAWLNVVEICLQNEWTIDVALRNADRVLDEYRSRFS